MIKSATLRGESLPVWLGWSAMWGQRARDSKPPAAGPIVLVLSPGGLGDALLLTGALRTLRRHFAPSPVWVLASSATRPFFIRCADRVIALPGGRGPWISLRRAVAILPIFRVSCRILMHPIYSTVRIYHQIARLVESPEKVWFDGEPMADDEIMTEDPRRFYTRIVAVDRNMRELDKLAAMLRNVGVENVSCRRDIWPDIGLSEAEQNSARERIAGWRGQRAALVLAVCPGGGFAAKDWGAERFADFLRIAAEHRPIAAFLAGGRQDGERARRICGAASSVPGLRIIDLTGRCSVRETVALIGASDACVGNDTFGLHAAVAMGTPSVVVMGGGDFPRWATWGEPSRHVVLTRRLDCFGCRWRCRYGDFRCVRDVSPESVLNALREVVGERQRS